MTGRQRDLTRRELLTRSLALGSAAIAGSFTNLFAQQGTGGNKAKTAGTNQAEGLRANLHGRLLTPADAGYDKQRKLWNGMIDKHPLAIARCADTADVINTIRYARDNDLAVSVPLGQATATRYEQRWVHNWFNRVGAFGDYFYAYSLGG